MEATEEEIERMKKESSKRKKHHKDKERHSSTTRDDSSDEKKEKKTKKEKKHKKEEEKYSPFEIDEEEYYKIFEKTKKYCSKIRANEAEHIYEKITTGSLTDLLSSNLGLLYYGENKYHTPNKFHQLIKRIYKDDVEDNILLLDRDHNFIGIYPDQCLMEVSDGFMENTLKIFTLYKDNPLLWRGKTDEEKKKEKEVKDYVEQKIKGFSSVMFDFTWISSSLLDTIVCKLYSRMEKENPFSNHIDKDLMKTHISDMKLILDTILKKKIVKFINHDAKELDKEERLTSFKECLQRVVEKELDVESIEQQSYKVINSQVDYDMDKSIKNRNKYKDYDKKETRNKEDEENLINFYNGFLLIENKHFIRLLNKVDEDNRNKFLRKYFYKIEHSDLLMIRNYKAISLLGALKLKNDWKKCNEEVKLRPKKWKDYIEHNEENLTEVYSDREDYKSLFEDNDTKITLCIDKVRSKTTIVDGVPHTEEFIKKKKVLASISELNNDFKVFRINNMELFTSFNSVLHFYNSQGRKDLYKLEYVYYRFHRCYAVERIINKSPITMEDVIHLIEGHKSNFYEGTYTTYAACILKCLKLTGLEDSNKEGVTLISHPAILPLYVFVPIFKLNEDIPKEFKMTYFERYMKVESKVNQRGIKFNKAEFVKLTDEFSEYCYNGVYFKNFIQPLVSIGINFLKYILKIEDFNLIGIISDLAQVIPKLTS